MSWLNLNESLNNIKGQISSFASGVLADGIVNDADPFTELSAANQRIQELQNLCASQDVEIASLRRQNAEYYEKLSFGEKQKNAEHETNGAANGENWFWDPLSSETNDRKNTTNSTISDLNQQILNLETEKSVLNQQIIQLENEKRDLSQSLEQLDFDCQKTTDKLVTLKDNLQSEYSNLKTEYDMMKSRYEAVEEQNLQYKSELEKFRTNSTTNPPSTLEYKDKFESLLNEKDSLELNFNKNKTQLNNLKIEFNKLNSQTVSKEAHEKVLEELNSLKAKNAKDLEKNAELLKLIEDLKMKKEENFSDDQKNLYDQLIELKLKYDELQTEKQEMHKKYVGILTETVKKYVDYTIPDDFRPNDNLSEFNSKVETVLKLLLDFKWKTETLEKKLCEISQEKNTAIQEKNHEIEKLLHNSEILSQEVITKTQTIKHYEIECSELIKNNDLLIAELQQYKNNNGLQTISESNEDNLLLLEQQLENANKRIRELEVAINEIDNAKQDVALETQTELDYIKKQLNMTGKELSQSKKEYQDLLNRFKQIQFDNQNLSAQLAQQSSEKEHLESSVIKLKTDFENTEYKYTEINVNLETIKDELNSAKKQHSEQIAENQICLESNKALSTKIELLQKEVDSLKAEINTLMEINEKHEHHTRNLTEKLQSSKMSETGLKLQNDTIKRELEILNETRVISEQKLQKFDEEFYQITTLINHLLDSQSGGADENLTIFQKLDRIKTQLITKTSDDDSSSKQMALLESKIVELENANLQLRQFNEQLEKTTTEKIQQFETEITALNQSKTELVNLIQTKHQDNIQYYSEIQRLNQVLVSESEKLKNLEQQLETPVKHNAQLEKLTDQNNFLKEKCEKLTQNLLDEQSNTQKIVLERNAIAEKEQSLVKELERLRLHLVEIEDTYTKELLQAEQKTQEMCGKINAIEQRERDSSTIYTSVSIRANQQVETLQNQLQLVTVQRDELQKRISEAEDKNNKQVAALTNLQCVLEQFQKDRESDILNETERIRRQINVEIQKQSILQGEINALKAQLEESKQGLKAASRLTEQMERSNQQVITMKDEVTKLQDQLSRTEEKYKALINQTDAKVDKTLIRNLIVGFISANSNLNKDQMQILKIISTVLDFSQQDNEKLNLNRNPNSWLGGILQPQAIGTTTGSNIAQQSLSEAFVRFLETESQPKPSQPPLINMRKMSTESNASTSSSTRQNPLLSEVVLPTFADFAQNRNSSSILKDVLKEN